MTARETRRRWGTPRRAEAHRSAAGVSEAQLEAALDAGQFSVHYQPEVALASGTVVGVEALVRWTHPTRGLLAPGAFMQQLEASPLIVPFGRWVLQEACAALARLQAGHPYLRMNVNVSVRQLSDDGGLVEAVRQDLATAGLAADALTLEVTETAMMREPEHSQQVLRAVRRTGVQVAIDDFGTGYSSLAQLSDLPASIIKLDKRFIDDVHRSVRSREVVRCVLALATSLGMTVTAEGIESPLQAGVLRAMGCVTGQGFLFSRPVPERLVVPQLLSAPQLRRTAEPLPRSLADREEPAEAREAWPVPLALRGLAPHGA